MAQPVQFVLKYTGSMEVKAGDQLLGSSISIGNVLQMKTKGVKVIINNTGVMFPITYDDLSYLDATATYTFDKDCIIAIGEMTEVT